MKLFMLGLLTAGLLLVSCQSGDQPTSPGGVNAEETALLGAPAPESPTIDRALHRPIGDFIDAQGTTNLWQPYGDEVAWAENPNQYPQPNGGWFDWLGFAAAYYAEHGGPNFGTQVTGNVTEQPIVGGRRVHVTLHTVNAIAWAIDDWLVDNAWTDSPTLIGAREDDVFDGATPALGDCHFTWIFSDTYAPGAPLPDLVATFNVGMPWPYIDWANQLTFTGTATGPLHEISGWPEGTMGRLSISQVGHLASPNHSPNFDGFPVENVRVRALGG